MLRIRRSLAWTSFRKVAIATLLALPQVAYAQSVSQSANGFEIEREVERSSGEYPFWINYQDCIEDYANRSQPDPARGRPTTIHFNTQVSTGPGNQNKTFEVWATDGSANCTENEERQTNGRCWLVGRAESLNSGGLSIDTYVRPRAVVRGKPTNNGNLPSDEVLNEAGEEICNNGKYNQQSFNFYLLLAEGSDVIASDTWDNTTVDTVAPPPPSKVEVCAGDERLFLNWTIETESEDNDTQGFTFYCEETDQGSGGAPAFNSGCITSGTAGAAGSSGSELCPEVEHITPGEKPEEAYRCGTSTGKGSREGRTNKLKNGTEYVVAIASTDLVFNQSALSRVGCGIPQPVTTFFDAYTDAGGQGGGGFCGFDLTSRSSLLVISLSLGIGLLYRRRRSL
ncbi:MAG: hypothetical protein MK135_02800 [Polyangiaceae bacterium]|nr:hypothetical protein [Polyangiaceae bacterium]